MRMKNTLGKSVPITYVKTPELTAEPLNAIIDCLRTAGFPASAKSLYLVISTGVTRNLEWQRFVKENIPDFDRHYLKLDKAAYQAANLTVFGVPVVWSETAKQIRCGQHTTAKQ